MTSIAKTNEKCKTSSCKNVMKTRKKCKIDDTVCFRRRALTVVVAAVAAFIASPIDDAILVATGVITVPIAIASSSVATAIFWVVIPVISFFVTLLLANLLFKWLAKRSNEQ